MNSVFRLTAMLLVVTGVILPTVLGVLWADYNWIANYLSELGADGAPHADIMNLAGFVPAGILWALCVLLLYLHSPRGGALIASCILLLATSLSYAGASIYPCEAGCPATGGPSQALHNLLGIVGYLTTIPALFILGGHYRKQGERAFGSITFIAGALFALGFAAMASGEAEAYRGAAQRLADFSLFIWMAAAAFILKPSAHQAS